jgi:hypothetical protein
MFLLTGCVSFNKNYTPTQTIYAPHSEIQNASINDVIVKQGFSKTERYMTLSSESKGVGYTFGKGTYKKIGEDGEVEFFLPGGPDPGYVSKSALTDPWQSLGTKNNRLCIVTVFNIIGSCREASFTVKDEIVESYIKEIIYLGIDNDIVTMQYTEYSKDITHPSYTEALTYQIGSQEPFRFRGLTIEFLQHSGNSVTFRIINPFTS